MTTTIHYLANLNGPEICGIFGFLCYVCSFAAVQLGILSGDSIRYSAANAVAAALVLISLTVDFNLASVLIQLSFGTIALMGIARRLQASKSHRDAKAAKKKVGLTLEPERYRGVL